MTRFLPFLLLLSLCVKGQQERLLDSIVQVTKQYSIYKDKVDWNQLQPKIYNAVDTNALNDTLAILPAIGLMLDSLNDYHSFVTYNGKSCQRSAKVDLYSRINKETQKAIGWPEPTPISTKKISNDIAYIVVPGMNVNPEEFQIQVNKLGQTLRDSLCHLNPEKLKGIIVDLRLNTGGCMYPMFCGIGPLLDNGKVGSFVNQEILEEWNINDGNFYLGKYQVTNIKNICIPNKKIKVAVIIGPATGSSGEALAISFIGQNNVKTIGEKSFGFTSANKAYQFSDALCFYLASGYEQDRNGKIYFQQIDPDIEILGGDNFENLLNDNKIKAAIKWIEKEIK